MFEPLLSRIIIWLSLVILISSPIFFTLFIGDLPVKHNFFLAFDTMKELFNWTMFASVVDQIESLLWLCFDDLKELAEVVKGPVSL